MKVINCLFILLLTLSCLSCKNRVSNENGQLADNGKARIVPETTSSTPTANDEFMERGEKVYNRVCLACHQSDGSGVPMMYPPVIESEFISGNTDSLIVIILEGLSGPMIVKGEEYNSIMPPMKDVLDDQEVADLINYLRNSYGNTGEFVKPDDVAEMR